MDIVMQWNLDVLWKLKVISLRRRPSKIARPPVPTVSTVPKPVRPMPTICNTRYILSSRAVIPSNGSALSPGSGHRSPCTLLCPLASPVDKSSEASRVVQGQINGNTPLCPPHLFYLFPLFLLLRRGGRGTGDGGRAGYRDQQSEVFGVAPASQSAGGAW